MQELLEMEIVALLLLSSNMHVFTPGIKTLADELREETKAKNPWLLVLAGGNVDLPSEVCEEALRVKEINDKKKGV